MPEPAGAWILFGRLGKPHGLKGQILLHPYHEGSSLVPRIRELRVLQPPLAPRTLKVRQVLGRPGAWIVALVGIDDRNAAESLKQCDVEVAATLVPPAAPDEFYSFELEGLIAVRADGRKVGRIRGLDNFGAGDLLVIEHAGDTLYLPFAEPWVGTIDREARTVLVEPDDFLGGGDG
jgi:16S rRNA processing protein RimM